MEIRDYVTHLGWRLLLLVLLPVLAGAGAFALLADSPGQYEADGVLTVPSAVVGGSTSGSVAQYMANFEQAVLSDPVVDDVAEATGVDPDDVRSGLGVTQLGNSNLVRIDFRGPDPAVAKRIVGLATTSAFDVVARIQLPVEQNPDVLRSRVDATTSELNEAETALQDFLLENHLVLPREQYLLVASDISRLESDIVQAESAGQPTTTLEAALADRRRELKRLAAAIPEYEQLQAAVDTSQEDLHAAQEELRLAEEQLANVKPQMTEVRSRSIPRIQTVGRGVAVAAGGGFVVAIALTLLFPPRRAFPFVELERSSLEVPSRS